MDSRWLGTAGRGRLPSTAASFIGARFHRGFRSFAFYGGPVYSDYYGDYSCWQWYPGRYGYVRIWVC